jgi:hypothetical protein
MIKKLFVGLTITIILVVGIFGLVKTTYAQEGTDIPETAEDNITIPDPQTLEYEYMYQEGAVNGDVEALQTQTRTRLFEMQDGECDADCDPIQLREQIGINDEGIRQQDRKNLGEFDCTGECDPQQLQFGNGANGYGGTQQSNISGFGTCDGTGIMGGQGQGYKGGN